MSHSPFAASVNRIVETRRGRTSPCCRRSTKGEVEKGTPHHLRRSPLHRPIAGSEKSGEVISFSRGQRRRQILQHGPALGEMEAASSIIQPASGGLPPGKLKGQGRWRDSRLRGWSRISP